MARADAAPAARRAAAGRREADRPHRARRALTDAPAVATPGPVNFGDCALWSADLWSAVGRPLVGSRPTSGRTTFPGGRSSDETSADCGPEARAPFGDHGCHIAVRGVRS